MAAAVGGDRPPFAVLALDGGGVRGRVSAGYLEEMEKITGKAVRDLFKLMGGTSAGGLNALSLSVPNEEGTAPAFSARDIVQLYDEQAATIFPRGLSSTFWWALSANGAFFPKFSQSGLEQVLKKYGGETKMKDLLGEVAVLSVQTNGEGPTTFTRELSRTDARHANLTVQEVVCAGTAAPGEFGAYPLTMDGKTTYWMDGGAVDNDPVEHDVNLTLGKEEWTGDLMVCSIGTGRPKEVGVSNFRAAHIGKLGWLGPIWDLHETAFATEQDRDLKGRFGDRYQRFQIELEEVSTDNSSPEYMALLRDATAAGVERDHDRLEDFCRRLVPDS